MAGPLAFKEAGIAHKDVDHLMSTTPRASADLWPRRSGFCRARRRAFIADGNTAPGGKLPLNTNGGGFSYMHSGMYGMYALQESVRRCAARAGAGGGWKISVCHGVGGMFAAFRYDYFYK